MASGSNLRIGRHLYSCITEVQLANEFTIDGRQVVFIDTNRSDIDILTLIATFLATTWVVLFTIHPLTSTIDALVRYEHGSFTSTAFPTSGLRELLDRTSRCCVSFAENRPSRMSPLALTCGERFHKGLGKNARRNSPNWFSTKAPSFARHHNTVQFAHNIARCITRNQPAALQIQHEFVNEGKGIIDTAAGEAINKELNQQIRHHQAELKVVMEETVQAMKEKDEEMRWELEEARKLQEYIERTRVNLAMMTSRYDKEGKETGDAIRRVWDRDFRK